MEARIIVVTQYGSFVRRNVEVSFDELKEDLFTNISDIVIGVIKIGRTEESWKIEIEKILRDEDFDN